MATNIEEIFRSFVVSKFREIQEEQQQHSGGKVEGQPNGDTIPVEQANPTDDTVAGAGSLQNDQIVQKIEEVLSGALDTEPQCKSDVDKNTVKNSTQSTKRSSTGEDEIPKKKSKKNKKHKSKKKKKKKKKRKKEKKHKKQPKESKLSTRHGEQGAVQPASLLLPETSSSKLSVQHGGFGDANLAVHMQPQELCLKASEALDRQVLGLASQQPAENLGSERGTLCATNPPFNLEGSQSDTQENASITQTRICTIQEQINQSHQSIYPIAVNASDQGVLVDTGSYNLSSSPFGVANKSESQKGSEANLASEVTEVQRGSEVLLKSADTKEVKTLGTTAESETMEVLKYSEAPLQSAAQMGAKVLEATSWASDVTTIPQSASQADLNTVKVAHVSMTVEEMKIPEGTEQSLLMGNVKNVERSLELGGVSRTLEPSLKPSVISDSLTVTQCRPAEGSIVSKADVSLQHPFEIPATTAVTQIEIRSAKTLLGPEAVTEVKDVEPPRSSLQETLQPVAVVKSVTLETVMEPVGITAADVQAAQECLQVGVVKAVGGTAADPATVLSASGVFLHPKVMTETRSVDRTQESATLQLENTNASKMSESTLKTVVVSETKDSEGSSLLRRPEELRESRSENELNVRGLEATPLSLQKEDRDSPGGVPRQMIVVEGAEDTVQYGTAARAVSDAGLRAMEIGSIRPVRSLETTVAPVSEAEGKTSSSHLHMKDVEYQVALAAAKAQALEAILQPGTPAVLRVLGENVCSEVKMVGSKALEASPGFTALEERSERTPESVVARVGMEPVRPSEALAGMMHLKSTAEREPKHAEPLGASKANLLGVEGVADVRGVEVSSQMSHLTQMKNLEMALGSETRTLRHSELASEDPNQSKAMSKETVLAAVQTLEASSEPVQEQVLGHSVAVLESLPRGEEKTMDSEILTEGRNLKGALESKILTDVRTQGPTVEYIIATKRTSTQRNEPSLIKEKLEAASETEKAVEARYLESASQARDVGLLDSMKEPAVEVKGSVHMVIQGLETSQMSGNVGAINILESASEAIPESLHTENQEHLQAVLEAKPAAEWKSTEKASEISSAAEIVSSEAVPKPGDTKDLGKPVDHAVAEVQHAEGVQDQPMEDVRVPGQAQEGEMLVEQKDAEQAQVSEPLIAEAVFSSSQAVDEKASAGTPDSEMIRETQEVEGAPAHLGETKDLDTAALPETVAEVKDAEEVGLETETKDLEAAEVPEAIAEAVPEHVAEASQSEVTPQTEAVKEATPEQESEKRDSETSEVQPDVAARMRETLMRLEKVEKSSHRSSDKKHDAKKQKRSRSKSQSRSRKRKKKSRSRSTSRRLTSKRGRSRSRNYSVSRKKHSKSRSRSVEKRERRLSSRRSRRRRSRSSDRYRSKSRSAEKRLSSGRSRRRRSRSSDRYRSKSGSVDKRLSSRRSRRRRSRSSDRYRSKSGSVEKRLSSRRSGRRRSRSSDRYRSKSRSVDKRLSSRRSGRRRSRSSDRYRSKSGSVDKRLSSRRSGRRRSRSSDRYRSKSRSVDKRLSSRRSGRRHSRSSERYRSKSPSVDKRGSRLSSWRSRRRRSRSSDRSKSRSRSSEKRGGKEYSWRFRNRSVSSDRSKSRSRSVEKRGRKSSLRRSKRQRSKSSDRYKSRSRSAEKRDRKQSSRKSKRQRSKSSDRYKSRSKSVEKKKESSRKSKRRRSKSSDRYKSRSRSVEKKRKESSKKSKRKRSKSSDSVKSRSKSVEKRDSKLSSVKGSSKRMESSELQESIKCPETVDVSEPPFGSEGTSSKSSNGPMSVSLSAEGLNGPELPPASESGLPKPSDSLEQNSSPAENTVGLQPPVVSEFDPDDHVPKSTPVEESQVSVLSMTSENGSTDKAVALESSSLPELTYSTPTSVSVSVEKEGDAETPSVTEFQLSASASHDDELRSTSLKETEGPEPHLTLESGCSGSSDDYKTISLSSGKNEIQESSLMSDSVLSDLSDGHELRHIPVEKAELQKFLEVPESSKLAGSPQSLSFETAESQKSFLSPQVPCSVFPESASLPIETGQMQEHSLASESGCFKSLDGHGSRSCVAARIPLISEDGSFTSPDENEQISLSVEKIKASAVSLTSECGPVEISDVVLTAVGQSCKSSEVLDSVSSVDKDIDGPTLSQVLHCSESSEMQELRYLPDGKIESTGSFLISKSGIPVGHDGHKANHNYLEKTEGAELLLASELRHSLFPEGYKLTSTPVEKTEIPKSPLPLESEFSNSVNVCESVSTPNEKLQAPVTSVTSEGGLFLLTDSHELRPFSAENIEVQKSPRVECIASTDGYSVRSSNDEEIKLQEPSLMLESRCAVSSDGHDLTFTPSEKAEVEEPSQVSENEYTIGLGGPELTSTPTERAEMRELYHMSEENCSVSIESQKFHSALAEQIEMQEPGLMSENEHTVSWKAQELRSSSPEKFHSALAEQIEMQEPGLMSENEHTVSWKAQEWRSSSPEKVETQEASVVAANEYAVSSELPSSLAEKAEVQECSLLSENEYAVSPEIQDTSASPEKEVQEPSLTSDSQYTILPEDQGLQSTLAERTLVQEPSPILDSQYAASPEGQKLLSAHAEKAEVQESSLLSENEYVVSPEGHDMRPSPVGKEEMEEHSETSESESSMSTDSQELQSTVAGKTEVQELSLMSEGECAMSPQGQGLQSSPTEEAENEHALSPEEYESRLTHAEKMEGMDSSLTSENDHVLSFESQEARFTPVQRVDAQELSPIPETEHEASPDGHELGFHTEPLMLNSRASMSPDHSDLKSIPVEKINDAVPESACSMSPDCYSVKSGPGEEAGDVEPSLIPERRHSTSSYQESHEPKSPMEEEGPEPSLTSEHRHSTSPDDRESRSSVGEDAEYLEQPLTTERRSSVSSDEHESRSTTGEEVEDAEPSLTAERRDSTSSDEHESRSATGEDVEDREPSLAGERRHSTSSDDRESRSTTGEEMEDLEPSLTAEHRRSVSPDGRESRSSTGEEAEDQELSLTAERRHSTSSDEHESRSTAGEDVEDMEPSLTAERRDSTSSDDRESRSTAGEEAEDMEQSLTTEHRRSTSPDGRESRSTTGEEGDDMEPSSTAERRDSTSSDEHESRSSTGEEGEDAETSVGDEDKQGDEDKLERLEEEPDSRRSESSEREKSRSKSVDKMSDKGSSRRSISRHSRSPTRQKSRSTSVEKGADKESSWRSRHRRSRSTSVEKTADKESSQRSRHRRSGSAARQRSRSASVEKAADKESRRSRRRRSRSTAHQRSRSKSVEKTADKESRRSRSRRSRSSQRRSQRYDTRRNRSRSATRRRASRSKSNRRSRSSSLSRSRHRRRSRSRSASRRRRSLSRDRRKRSQRNRSRSTDRRRRRSDSRDRRISLRLRSRSRTPIRQRRSRSRGRRRSSSRSPIRLRRSRSSGRRRYSRSPDRRRSRSSERFSSRSPKRLTDLDKAQLLEIAKANAAAMCAKSGVPLPPSLMPLLSQKKDDKANQKSSRDTLKELTEKCKKIAQSTDDVIVNKPHVSDEEEEERPFYHHPFKLSEPKPIFFNLSTPSIKPAPPPQPKNQVSLSKEFPVSSGSQHRKKEADSVYGEWVPVEKGKEDSKDDVFPKPAIECVDITTAMNDRAIAQKRLNENTFDLEAMCMLNRAQEQIDAWAQSNSIPGQFTGSTGAQILSSDELTNSGPQAWIRKDQFLRAAPVTGGMGAQLMRKMGWREGEGLGKNKEGSVEPIMVDFKTDRKGLVAVGEKAQKRSGHYVVMKDLSGKHPVSALMEICNKRRWTPPEFVLVDDSGPDHRKHFIFKVRVNGNEYRPTFASLNKKHAKATAATAALQAMGLVPKESMVNTTMFRSASHR
ncbi:protein SON isoform X2 [Heliangelus exortis]|uniref:protein SON isoform X2 n=1 Tax=Heliangelus exortis TaxID=472823 RepID=UPI003A8D845C